MDQTFDWCVNALVYGAHILGITYKEINVWIFVILWPIRVKSKENVTERGSIVQLKMLPSESSLLGK